MSAPDRIWIDAWGGNWSDRAGGTQESEYVRADIAADLLAALVKSQAMLRALVDESGRDVEWGHEDAFRMGEWFERDDLAALDDADAIIARAKGGAA